MIKKQNNKQKLIIFVSLIIIILTMDEFVKQALQIILHERMKTKAALEILRFNEETDRKKSYKKEIDKCLDRLNELNDLFDKIRNQY